MTTARNFLHDRKRHLTRRRSLSTIPLREELGTKASGIPTPQEILSLAETDAEIRAAMQRLSPRSLALIQTYARNRQEKRGEVYRQMAVEFGIPEGTVKSRLTTAFTELARMLPGYQVQLLPKTRARPSRPKT